MMLWQYFNCGKGKTVLFSGLEFVSGLIEIEPFEGGENFSANRNQKRRKDRCLNAGVYCSELSCLMFFNTEADLQNHQNENAHNTQNKHTSMDSILLHHADLLVCLSNSKSLREIDAEAIVTESKFKLERNIDVTGWAIPVHKHT